MLSLCTLYLPRSGTSGSVGSDEIADKIVGTHLTPIRKFIIIADALVTLVWLQGIQQQKPTYVVTFLVLLEGGIAEAAPRFLGSMTGKARAEEAWHCSVVNGGGGGDIYQRSSHVCKLHVQIGVKRHPCTTVAISVHLCGALGQ